MSFPSKKPTQNSQPRQNFKLSQKGLGWVPDVPEQRDYTLHDEVNGSSNRLKNNKRVESSERVGEALLYVLEAISARVDASKGFDKSKILQILKGLPDTTRAKVFGEVSLRNFGTYKILRKGVTDPDVLKLKRQLSILGYRGFYSVTDFQAREVERDTAAGEPSQVVIKFSQYPPEQSEERITTQKPKYRTKDVGIAQSRTH